MISTVMVKKRLRGFVVVAMVLLLNVMFVALVSS